MKPWPLAVLLLMLAGCSDPGPPGPSTTTTTTQEPVPDVQFVWVNRTLTITGERSPSNPNVGFVAAPGNANCVYFQRIGKAGLSAIEATADGENPETVTSWELRAHFPGSQPYMGPSVEGALPLTLNVTGLEVEDQSELYIDLSPSEDQPAVAAGSPAVLTIRLSVLAPAELYVQDTTTSCD